MSEILDPIVLETVVPERATSLIGGVLQDEAGAPVGSGQILTFRMTILLAGTATVVNAQQDVNVLNANQGTLDGSGNFALTLTPADNQIVDASGATEEVHRVQLEWSYGPSGVKTGRCRIDFTVANYDRVP